jgi:integrase
VRHLQEHKKRQDAERLALGDTWREHGLVFASTIGTPIKPRNVNRRWDELRPRAGLDWLRLHDLRHGCATFLLAQGVPARAIMEVLGHAEIGVKMNTYAHVLPVLRQEAADAIDELFRAWSERLWLQKRPFHDRKWPPTWRARRDSNPQPSDP